MKDEICLNLGYRKLRGLTQQKLADLLGMEIKSLSLIETGNCFVSSRTLAKLATILDIYPPNLLEGPKEENSQKIYQDILNALEKLKNNPAKLKALNYILNGLL